MERNVNPIDNSRVGVRSNQNLSFTWLGSTDFGVLRPFHWEELLPTDKIVKCHPRVELQMLPLASPTFGRMSIYIHYFFVPTRLLWSASSDVFSRRGAGSNSYPPTMTKAQFCNAYIGVTDDNTLDEIAQRRVQRGLYKHFTSMGLPPFFALPLATNPTEGSYKISTLPFRAYNQIWWDFYRDPELISDASKSSYIKQTSGAESDNEVLNNFIYVPRRRAMTDVWFSSLFASDGYAAPGQVFANVDATNTSLVKSIASTSKQERKIEALTRLAERLSLSGKRAIDTFFSLYGIKPEYMKLNMCQYIGGAKQDVYIQDITSSADTSSVASAGSSASLGAALGQKAGSGYCQFNELDIQFEAKEHGYLMGILSVMPKVHFVQGLEKRWARNQRDDFFSKEFEHVGQVAVAAREIGTTYYARGVACQFTGNEDATFGFADPYYEYKQRQDILAGDFMWYHTYDNSTTIVKDIAYMQSMGVFNDYAQDRVYNAENMSLDTLQCNKIFFYQGGNMWDDVDDHFHINADVECVINRPMDGYAVPTLETTQDPHKSAAPIGNDRIL